MPSKKITITKKEYEQIYWWWVRHDNAGLTTKSDTELLDKLAEGAGY